ncbi:MAG: hypothetical protein V7655_08350 [Aequorivita antarctica]
MVLNYFPKVLITCIVMVFAVSASHAQVGIGTVTPEGVLDLNDDSGPNKYGLVLPRVALTRTDLAAPVVDPDPGALPGTLPVGTVVYNTTTTNFGSNSVYPGIYMWDGIDWINEFPKKNAEIFKQDNSSGALRTVTTGTYQGIPNLVGRTFTPAYTGTYKIEVSVNWGGGYVNNSGFGTDVAVMTGVFKFEFDSDPDKLIPAHTWSGKHGGGTQYYDIWEQSTVVIYKDLVANTPYTFSLSFDQTMADGFENSGDSGNGRGWLGGDIPCTIEFVFLD